MKKGMAVVMMICILAFTGSVWANNTCPPELCPAGGHEEYWQDYDDLGDYYLQAGSPDYVYDGLNIDTADDFKPGEDKATYFYLTIYLKDDTSDSSGETVDIKLEGALIADNANARFDYFSGWGTNATVLASINLDGNVIFTLTPVTGDFKVEAAQLDVYGWDCNPYQVPEPVTMLLLGFGLLSIAGLKRKMTK